MPVSTTDVDGERKFSGETFQVVKPPIVEPEESSHFKSSKTRVEIFARRYTARQMGSEL